MLAGCREYVKTHRTFIFLPILVFCVLFIAACDKPSAGAPVRIMPLGNSITQGEAGHRSYRYELWKMLRRDGFNVDFVGTMHSNFNGDNPEPDFDQDHEGHWGWRADQVLTGVPGRGKLSDFLKNTSPDIVLMHLGSNDIFQGDPEDQVISELKDILTILWSSNNHIVILLAQILPVANPEITGKIIRLNREIEKLPAARDSRTRVLIVDQFDGFDPYKDTYDGVHPNRDGEMKMAAKWYEALRPVLEQTVTGRDISR